MTEEIIVADVKCYFCGHISGKVATRHGKRIRASRFIPRPGYRGPEITTGSRLRCERCQGPVFLEDATRIDRGENALAKTLGVRRLNPGEKQKAA